MDLSINICCLNNRDFLKTCLRSVYERLGELSCEVLVVDNGSTDGTVEMLQSTFPEVILIRNEFNRGVARARNQSIRISKGRYILLLDADTEFIEGSLKSVLDYMDSAAEVGLLGVKQVSFEDEPYPAARTFPNWKHVLMRRLAFIKSIGNSQSMRRHHLMNFGENEPLEVDYVIGAFQLIKREVIDLIGVLDEKMFYGFEDADYCARIKKAHFKVIYYPKFTMRHYVQGMTRKRMTVQGAKLGAFQVKSYIRFYLKNRDLLSWREQ